MNNTLRMVFSAIFGVVIGAGGVLLSKDKDVLTDGQYPVHDRTTVMQDEMSSMMHGLDGRTGDAFDQTFLAEMIAHHQGAIAMAETALQNAKHQEIKTLAQNIIIAQHAEIKQMQGWQAAWYGTPKAATSSSAQ